MTHGMYDFNDNIYFMAMVFNVIDKSIKTNVFGVFRDPVFFLRFLLFLTLQLEPPKTKKEVKTGFRSGLLLMILFFLCLCLLLLLLGVAQAFQIEKF